MRSQVVSSLANCTGMLKKWACFSGGLKKEKSSGTGVNQSRDRR